MSVTRWISVIVGPCLVAACVSQAPVWAADPPTASTMATQSFVEIAHGPNSLRLMRGGRSAAEALAEVVAGDTGENVRQVGMAPTPASTHGTALPTLNQRLWAATPSWPVARSRATIEYVITTPWNGYGR
jgi:Family of unknown function (DUF1028)